MINDILREIKTITEEVSKFGITSEVKIPVRRRNEIGWADQKDISTLLKSISYLDKYKVISDESNFNFRLLDGAIIQLLYCFSDNGRNLLKHRLAYYPSPLLERYENVSEEYQNDLANNLEFQDLIIEKYIVTSPVRFDYDCDAEKYISKDHPYSHMHLGEIENCRIPLKSPISPSQFINFILRNFYFTIFRENMEEFESEIMLDSCIDDEEKKLLHINF